MEREEKIRQDLSGSFGFLEGKITIPRVRRIFAETPRGEFKNVLSYIVNNLGFGQVCTITGLDAGEDLQLIYHLAESGGIVLSLKVNIPKADPRIPSILDINQGVLFYERELVDLLGVKVEGLPPGDNYPLPEGWPEGQYPLRKDWKPQEMLAGKEG